MKKEYKQEIERLYRSMYDKMLVYAMSVMSSEALAEEMVQEAFRIACLKPEAVCDSKNPEGWMLNALKNVMANARRSQVAAKRVLTDYLTTQIRDCVVSEDRIGFEVLYDNVADLEEFKLLKEMTIDGKSQLEIAQERGISLAACKKRVQRAKETLRKKIDE